MASNMFVVPQTRDTPLCCKCGGFVIVKGPNPPKACLKCLASEINIREGLRYNVTIMHCPDCDCYLQPPTTWIRAQYESKELLAFCVKQLETDLKSLRLVKAEFYPAKHRPGRFFVKLRVQKEIVGGLILLESHVVAFFQHDHKCEPCLVRGLELCKQEDGGEDGMRE